MFGLFSLILERSRFAECRFASSFGVNMWPESHKELLPAIDKLLHRFSGISVREVTGQNILKQQF